MNICHDCGKPIEPNKPHNHNTFVIIRGEKQALKDGQTIGGNQLPGRGSRWSHTVPVIVVVKQEGE